MTPPKVVLITGASSGIGRFTAHHLAQRGWRVFGGVRRPEAIGGLPGVEPLRLDVTDDASVSAAVDAIVERMGRIDGLVNNAGGSVLGAAEEISIEQARALLDLNVLGVLRMSQAVLPVMRRQGSGRIVNISSVVGFLPAPFMAIYAASKHAVEGLSESMDHEVRQFGIRVALVEPGFTRTNIDAAAPRADHPLSDYHAARKRVSTTIASQIAGAPDPTGVARTIERALDARRFARMPVGGEARVLSTLRKGMPAALFDRSLRRTYHLDGRPTSSVGGAK
mgnify:FL=1